VKLIVVRRSAADAFERLSRTFAGVPNVSVVWEQRTRDSRTRSDRRRFTKPWSRLGYFVIHTAEEQPRTELAPRLPVVDPTDPNIRKLARILGIPLATLLDFGSLTSSGS
jgi:hypothetical protein